jgi:hypothetical protein
MKHAETRNPTELRKARIETIAPSRFSRRSGFRSHCGICRELASSVGLLEIETCQGKIRDHICLRCAKLNCRLRGQIDREGYRMKRRRPRFRSFPDPRCPYCGGSGFAPADGISQQGKPMTGVTRCECWTVIDLRKPKKEKKVKTVYDGRAAAYVD